MKRGRAWQAELWISAARDLALELACLRRGLDASYGRELDRLPDDALEGFEDSLVRSLDRNSLLAALAATTSVLLRESPDSVDALARVEADLRELVRTT